MASSFLSSSDLHLHDRTQRKGYFLRLIIDLANDKLVLGFQGACPFCNFALVATLPNYCD